MFLFDCLLYSVLVWYIENVYPGQHGVPHPWYFPFTASYWNGTEAVSDLGFGFWCQKKENLDEELEDLNDSSPVLLEQEPEGLIVGVKIENLTKRYHAMKKFAVDRLNLTLYESQIVAFLGHNGVNF